MKHTARRLKMLALALAMVTLAACGSALAAESDDMVIAPPTPQVISVQLNGEALAFTDAVPTATDGRTFLPFRAVFEAMGAEVAYDADAKAVSASRDGTTVVMTLDSVLATVTKDDVGTELTMDVAPYAADNRTYVPVRFAAQAFGCAVGWDQDDQTVILVDTQKLLDTALAQREFTYLKKYMDYSEQFQQGIWDVDAKFDAAVTMMGAGPLTLTGTMEGTTAEGTQMAATMNMKMDMQALMEDMAKLSGKPLTLTDEDQAVLDAMKNGGIDLDVRADMAEGLMYMALSGSALETLELPADTWYSLDLAAQYNQLGLDYTTLMGAAKTMDLSDLLELSLSSVALNDKDTDYALVSALVDGVAKTLCDEAFVKDGSNYTATYTLDDADAQMTCLFTLIMDADKVVGYDISMKVTATGDQVGMALTMDMGVDAENQLTTALQMDMGEMMDMSMNITGAYTAGTTAPVTAPPTGANIISFDALTGQGA